jgi:WD40 repeat protein
MTKRPSGLAWNRVSGLYSILSAFALLAGCSPTPDENFFVSGLRELFGIGTVAKRLVDLHDDYSVFSVAFSPDGKQIASSGPVTYEVHIWAWQGSPRIIQTLQEGGGGEVNGLQYSPDGTLLASGHGKPELGSVVRIWNTSTWDIVGDLAGAGGFSPGAGEVWFSPDGRLLMFSNGGRERDESTFFAYDTRSWQPAWGLNISPSRASASALSLDGRHAAILGNDFGGTAEQPKIEFKVLIVDLAERRVLRSFEGPGVAPVVLAWRPDGKRIVMSGNFFSILDLETGRMTSTPVEATRAARTIEYSPNGKYLMIATDTGVEIWDSEYAKFFQKVPGQTNVARFSHDGRYLAMSAGARGISVWEMK